MIKLLLVEDDANLRYIIRGGLERCRQWRRRTESVAGMATGRNRFGHRNAGYGWLRDGKTHS